MNKFLGVSGQRKPRKSRTREIALASDEKLAFSYQPVPFQAPPYQRQQSVLQQQVSMSGHLNYNICKHKNYFLKIFEICFGRFLFQILTILTLVNFIPHR